LKIPKSTKLPEDSQKKAAPSKKRESGRERVEGERILKSQNSKPEIGEKEEKR
jgi:hypothetical protein